MSFDLKLFTFHSVNPFKIQRNGSSLYRVFTKKDKSRNFCLKVYQIESDKQKEIIENEVKMTLLASSLHSNVVQIKGNTITESKDDFGFVNRRFCILQEDIERTLEDLKREHQQKKVLIEGEELVYIMKTIISVLSVLEKNEISHRNLHLNAIFIADDLYKLGEFTDSVNTIGQSSTAWQELKNQERNYFDQKHYIDPELYQSFLRGDSGAEVNYFKSDVYALGVIFLELCTLTDLDSISLNKKEKLASDLKQIEKNYGNKISEMIESMLEQKASERPGFDELEQNILAISQTDYNLSKHLQMRSSNKNIPIINNNNLPSIKENTNESAGTSGKNQIQQNIISQIGNIPFTNSQITLSNNYLQSNEVMIPTRDDFFSQPEDEFSKSTQKNENNNQNNTLKRSNSSHAIKSYDSLNDRDLIVSQTSTNSFKIPQMTFNRQEKNIQNDQYIEKWMKNISLYQNEFLSQQQELTIENGQKSQTADRKSTRKHSSLNSSINGDLQNGQHQFQKKSSHLQNQQQQQQSQVQFQQNQIQNQQQSQNKGIVLSNQLNGFDLEIFDNMSCYSYSVEVRDSNHFEQLFGAKRAAVGQASSKLIMSRDLSKKAVQMMLEELNVSVNNTKYLLPLEQLVLKLKDLKNLSQIDNKEIKQSQVINKRQNIMSCQIQNNINYLVKNLYSVDNVAAFELLYQVDFYNGLFSKHVNKIIYYALHSKDQFSVDIQLVYKKKKCDLEHAMKYLNLNIYEKIEIASQLVFALNEIQNNGQAIVVHGDLKPSNILLDSKNDVFISEFGLNQINLRSQDNKKNSSDEEKSVYWPPELINNNKVEPSTDIWSLGIIFYELFFNKQATLEQIRQQGLLQDFSTQMNSIQELVEEDTDVTKIQQDNFFKIDNKIINTETLAYIAEIIQKMAVVQFQARMNPIEILESFNQLKNSLHNMAVRQQNQKNEIKKNPTPNNLEIVGVQFNQNQHHNHHNSSYINNNQNSQINYLPNNNKNTPNSNLLNQNNVTKQNSHRKLNSPFNQQRKNVAANTFSNLNKLNQAKKKNPLKKKNSAGNIQDNSPLKSEKIIINKKQ